jgi:elongation factor P--(R)-beta-lysine ligase
MADWQPSATLSNLKLRAEIYKKMRSFFEKREILEVETPLLCHSSVTDPHLASFQTTFHFDQANQKSNLYLQTSPEFAMKRLIAAGYGSLYQICKAFRNGEVGKRHNPEFTLLEWYRIGLTHHDLMVEVDEFLQYLLYTTRADKISYFELFKKFFDINPHTTSPAELKKLAKKQGLTLEGDHCCDTWLELLMTHCIEPLLGLERPVFIYDYPASQAALAKVKQLEGYKVGERFEVYYKGIELANGYHELTDSREQLIRFEQDNGARKKSGLPEMPIDYFLLEALHAFPECSGVALGIDRLIMLAANSTNLAEVITFPTEKA